MNKVVIGLVAGLVVAAGAPMVCGLAIEHGSAERLTNMLDLVPYVSVRERTFHRGWLSSEEVITFEAGTGAPLMPAALGSDVPPPKPLRFIVRNTIHHGPLPGLSGIGLASIDTHFEPAPGAAKLPQLPASLSAPTVTTTLDFLGGGHTVVRGAAIPATALPEGWQLAGDASEIDIRFGSHVDTVEIDWSAPHVLLSKDATASFELSGWKLKSKAHRVLRSLYAGDLDLTVGSVEFTDLKAADPKAGKFGVRAVHYVSTTAERGGFLDITGVVTAREAHAAGQFVQAIKLDIAMQHWQADALENLTGGMRKIRTESPGSQERLTAMMKLMKSAGVALVINDPVVLVRAFEVATEHGFAQVTASFGIKGATAADFEPTLNSKALLEKATIEAEIVLDDDLADFLDRPRGPSTPTAKAPARSALAGLIAQGFVTREKGKTRTRIAFAKGALTVNGKPFTPAALAPPPPPPGPSARPGKPVRPRPATAGA